MSRSAPVRSKLLMARRGRHDIDLAQFNCHVPVGAPADCGRAIGDEVKVRLFKRLRVAQLTTNPCNLRYIFIRLGRPQTGQIQTGMVSHGGLKGASVPSAGCVKPRSSAATSPHDRTLRITDGYALKSPGDAMIVVVALRSILIVAVTGIFGFLSVMSD